MTYRRLDLGRRGERLAAAYLMGLGMVIVQLNVRLKRAEIDIVARDNDVLVFVEVRSRSERRRVHPLETIRADKRRRVRAAARAYLQMSGREPDHPVRIDVVGVTFDSHGVELEHLENAM